MRPVDAAWPDGLELYLAAEDLRTEESLSTIAGTIEAAAVPEGFVWLIEGPVDSLDGQDFDVARDSQADLLVLQRLADLAHRIGARAVNIHVISPSPDLGRLTLDCRAALLERALPFLARFAELMQAAGTLPTVENMPPVLRMRRADFAFTPIGMASADLWWLTERVPGLSVLADTSHAGLYLNARRLAPDAQHPWSEPLARYLRQLPREPETLEEYLAQLPRLENAQVSNARGVLGEGLAYTDGDFDLDPSIRWLAEHARHLIAETLEADNNDAVLMRDALRRMRTALA